MRKPSSTRNVFEALRAGVGAMLGSLPRTALGGATMRASGSAARLRCVGADMRRITVPKKSGMNPNREERVGREPESRASTGTPPLPGPLLHPMEEREKSDSFPARPIARAKLRSRVHVWGAVPKTEIPLTSFLSPKGG